MPSKQPHAIPTVRSGWDAVVAGATGLWLALALIKWGNPVILDQKISVPTNWVEIGVSAWPVSWGYALLVFVIGLALPCWHWKSKAPAWLLVLPVAWLGWQFVSATQTADRTLTAATLPHFCACVAAFFLGHFALNRVANLRPFWFGVLGGFLVVLVVGWRQHFGGLEETRRFFYSLPDWQTYSPEFSKKLSSDRIYSTLFYPNALAGVVILLMPVALSPIVSSEGRISAPGRVLLIVVFGVLGLGCLYWSGSKAGWLIALGQMVFGIFHSSLRTRFKAVIVILILFAGLGGLWFKHQDYFGRGATSVSARLDYWKVAWITLAQKPLLGNGPGTFFSSYRQLKEPEAEMTRLVHNDFLQQGSDSGWPGLLAYMGWMIGSCWTLYRRSGRPENFGVWIGLVGVIGQGCVEFGLYVPALAWPTCCLLGWLLGWTKYGNRVDKPMLAF